MVLRLPRLSSTGSYEGDTRSGDAAVAHGVRNTRVVLGPLVYWALYGGIIFSWYLESCEYMMDIGSEQGLWDVTGKTRVVGPYPPTKNQLELQIIFCRFIDTPVHTNSTQYCELPKLSNAITAPDRIMEKRTGFNLQAPPVYDRKVPNFFFP